MHFYSFNSFFAGDEKFFLGTTFISSLKQQTSTIFVLYFTPMTTRLYLFLLINFIAFIVIGYDKRLAIRNKNRISEKALLTWVALGGTIGSSLAMSIFRHKTSKTSYLWKFTGIVCIQILIVFGLFYFDMLTL
jgi:uncharacterized membrane protein YsdA (DUF1294 family)